MANPKVKFDFNPLKGIRIKDKSVKDDILDQIASYVQERVLFDVGNQVSPVTGDKFPALDKDYAKRKRAEGGTPIANLELTGDMLSSLTVKRTSKGLQLTVGSDQQEKAAGHNHWYGSPTMPRRAFIPKADSGEDFSEDILKGIQSIIDDNLED